MHTHLLVAINSVKIKFMFLVYGDISATQKNKLWCNKRPLMNNEWCNILDFYHTLCNAWIFAKVAIDKNILISYCNKKQNKVNLKQFWIS